MLLNNDLSAGIPAVLRGLDPGQILVPPLQAGWAVRRKSNHFAAYDQVATEFSNVAIKTLSETIDPRKLVELEDKLKTTVQIEFLKFRKLPPRLDTRIASAQIKEAGPSEVITHLRLKLVEESFEWTTVETEGGKQDRLVIE